MSRPSRQDVRKKNHSFLPTTTLLRHVLASKVEMLGHFKTTDGMVIDDKGNLYPGDLENHQLIKIDSTLKMTTLRMDIYMLAARRLKNNRNSMAE